MKLIIENKIDYLNTLPSRELFDLQNNFSSFNINYKENYNYKIELCDNDYYVIERIIPILNNRYSKIQTYNKNLDFKHGFERMVKEDYEYLYISKQNLFLALVISGYDYKLKIKGKDKVVYFNISKLNKLILNKIKSF